MVTPNITYLTASGWVAGTKEAALLNIMPYLEMGFAVVNVEYRMGPVSLAPAGINSTSTRSW